MARSVLTQKITSTASYTVPPGKIAVIKAYYVKHGGNSGSSMLDIPIIVSGNQIALIWRENSTQGNDAHPSEGPITLAAGDVISAVAAGSSGNYEYGISGFLYDV